MLITLSLNQWHGNVDGGLMNEIYEATRRFTHAPVVTWVIFACLWNTWLHCWYQFILLFCFFSSVLFFSSRRLTFLAEFEKCIKGTANLTNKCLVRSFKWGCNLLTSSCALCWYNRLHVKFSNLLHDSDLEGQIHWHYFYLSRRQSLWILMQNI